MVLLGGPGVGKTSMLHKIINNYMEEESERESVASISQEIMRHAQRTETDEIIQIVFVSIFTLFIFAFY